MSDFDPQRWIAEFERQSRTGRVKLLDPLPRRVRARLWLARRIDTAACWLVEHVSPAAGKALWWACGMWR